MAKTQDAGAEARAHYARIPTSADGEFPFHGAQVADLNALTFTETARTPFDGDSSRSQGQFKTTDSTKRS
jgi:hypothetical protein